MPLAADFNPRVGDQCQCLQCRRVGRLDQAHTRAPFVIGRDGVVECVNCVDDVSSPCFYDVVRVPDDGVDEALVS